MSQQQLSFYLHIINSTLAACPPYDPKINYLLEAKKSAILNSALIEQIKLLNQQLPESIQTKKQRRKANQIPKQYTCHNCQKSYGSEASLNLHIKIKHTFSESESKTKCSPKCSPII